jgi:predicted HicB family RNase H-like nuclease
MKQLKDAKRTIKTQLRLPPEIHRELQLRAFGEGCSMNFLIVEILSKSIGIPIEKDEG